MRAFIIRPFGVKKGIDFDRVEQELIVPALNKLNIAGRTTGEILEAGNIRTDMFQELLLADLVIADISTNNANAFYELGIRHALRDQHTYLLRSRTREPNTPAASQPAETSGALSKKEDADEVPFDLRTDRYLAYDPTEPGKVLSLLLEGLQNTLAGDRKDSPVFLSLPNLKAPDRSQFAPVPQDFGEDVMRAVEKGQRECLSLLALEVLGLRWEVEGLRTVGRMQFKANYMKDAKSTWEAVRRREKNDVEANLLLATSYRQLNDITNSNLCVDRVLNDGTISRADRAEAYALRARNKKQLWIEEWRDLPAAERPLRAFSSPLLLATYYDYASAFEQDLNAFYPGINALALLVIFSKLVETYPEEWRNRFPNDQAAAGKLAELQDNLQLLRATVSFCIQVNQQRLGKSDRWLNLTSADWRLLTSDRPNAVEYAYREATAGLDEMAKDSSRRQLQIYFSLGVLTENANAALKALGYAIGEPPVPVEQLERVILFTGHRVDEPGRAKPRFPAACEDEVRAEIKKTVNQMKAITKGRILGIAGAASGGDILFHEVCRELGIETKICLALPPDQYIAASVKSAGGDWVQRFSKLVQNASDVSILAETAMLQSWLSVKKNYDIWQRNNLWELCYALTQDAMHFTLIALWDKQKGDGPGGTEHMVGIAQEREAWIEVLPINDICGTPPDNTAKV
jgi:hypothetical protein